MNKNLWLKVAMTVLFLSLCASTALAQDQSKGPPPFPPPPAQSLVENGYLYILIGPTILQYQLPDLGLKTVTLPAPEDSKQVSSTSQRPPMPPMLSMVTDGDYLYIVAPGYLFQYGKLPELELITKQALPKPEALK
jgi:hypothetical protein